MTPNRIKAFTIPELLVAMLVSAIILLAVLYGFQLVSGLLITTQKRSDRSINSTILYKTLKREIAAADSIIYRKDTIFFYQDTTKVAYIADSSRLIRLQYSRRDTLGAKVSIVTIEMHPYVASFVTKIILSNEVNGRVQMLNFQKEYSSYSLFERHSQIEEKQWESKYQK